MSRARTHRARRLPTRRLVYLAVFVLAALVGSAFVRVTLQENALARAAAGMQAEIAVLEAQQAMLRGEVALRSTPAYIEQKARDLGYVKPGEGLATVREDGARSSPPVVAPSTASRLERWLRLFFR